MTIHQDPDLHRVLALAAGPGESAVSEPGGDLARAQQALRVRRRRRFRYAASAMTTVAVVAVLLAGALGGGGTGTTPTPPDGRGPVVSDRVTLAGGPLAVAPYVFDQVPVGWHVQGQSPTALTIAPSDGSVSEDPDDFIGKLVVMFDRQQLHGEPVAHDGRTFHVAVGDDDYTTVSVRTTRAEPAGVVRVQYPVHAGWEIAQMLDFLAGVTVTDEARPGVG